MQQKPTWKHYLMLGISLLFTILFNQCKKKVDYTVLGTFVYINSTDSIIEIRNSQYNLVIQPNTSNQILIDGEGPEKVNEDSYVPPMNSSILIFNNFKCDTLNTGDKIGNGEGILGIKNYTFEKIAERNYKFTYTFNTNDLQKAKPCK